MACPDYGSLRSSLSHARPFGGGSLENIPILDLFPSHLFQQRAQRTYRKRMFFEFFADTGVKERGPELGASLTRVYGHRFWSFLTLRHTRARCAPAHRHTRTTRRMTPFVPRATLQLTLGAVLPHHAASRLEAKKQKKKEKDDELKKSGCAPSPPSLAKTSHPPPCTRNPESSTQTSHPEP